jgi:hypothetical protein
MVQLTMQPPWFVPKRPVAIPTKIGSTSCYRSVLQDHFDWFPLRDYNAPYGHHCLAHVDVASEKTLSTRTMTTPKFPMCNGPANDKNISQPSTCTCGCKSRCNSSFSACYLSTRRTYSRALGKRKTWRCTSSCSNHSTISFIPGCTNRGK